MTSRAIIGTPSYLYQWDSVHSLTADANYPAVRAVDKVRITNPWRSTSGGADWLYLTFSLPSPQVQLVALVGHNLGAAATMRVRLYSSTAFDNTFSQPAVYDSGVIPVWPQGSSPTAGYRQIRPLVLPQPLACGSLSVDVDTHDGSNAEIGALEVSGLWDLTGLSPGRQRTFDARTPVTVLAGGADQVPDTWIARTFAGGVDLVDTAITETAGMDFLQTQDLVNPFVFSPDVANPASWSRSCMLVRNQKITSFAGAQYRRDKVMLSLIEHQR